MEIITDTDLRWLCKYNTENEDKLICRKYLEDGEVTTDLLKIYVETEIETWGDMIKGLIEFKYENTIIVGRYNNGDYPAEILSITNKEIIIMETPNKTEVIENEIITLLNRSEI